MRRSVVSVTSPPQVDDPPLRAAGTAGRPTRVLMLAPRFPYPPFGGDRQFLLNVARALRHCRITLLSFCGSQSEMDYVPSDGVFASIHRVLLPRWQSMRNVLPALLTRTPLQLAYYRSSEFQRRVDELAPQHDVVLAHLIRTGQYVAHEHRQTPRVLLMSDAISMTYSRMSHLKGTSPLWSLLYRTELNRLNAYERECPANFDQTWLHSDVDRRFLGLSAHLARVIPMGVDLREYPFEPRRSGNVVVFVGNLSSSMNQDACRHFVRDMLPRLRTKAGLRFRTVGPCPARFRSFLEKHEGVDVAGAVPRICDAVHDAFCGVCSVRGGAGIQNKVLNYLALGLPCVTSEIGLEGIPAVNGRDLMVYRTAEEAADMILRLHDNAELRATMAAHGRRLIEERFDWEGIYRVIANEVAGLSPARQRLAA